MKRTHSFEPVRRVFTVSAALGFGALHFACNHRPPHGKDRAAAPASGSEQPNKLTAVDAATPRGKALDKSGFRIALVGDEGIGERARAVLQLIRDQSADALVVLGDFDYENKAQKWAELLGTLGADFPWFAVVGNHDVQSWPAYEPIIANKQRSIKGADCRGKPGVQSSCLFHNVQLIMSEIGTMGDAREEEAFIKRELAESRAKWKLCLWHKNQHDMQTGAKTDEVGWGAYIACQQAGAIIASGHEHSYERTRTLTKLGDHASGHGALAPFNELEVAPGKTFVVVSGLGGIQTRPFVGGHANDTWWGAYLTSDRDSVNGQVKTVNDANVVGAFFLDLNVDGDSKKGRGRFVTTTGRVFDDFAIHFAP